MGMTSVGNPLHQKMTSEHISQVLDLAAKHDERQYNLHKTTVGNDHWEWIIGHAMGLVAFIVVVALVVVVLCLFRDKPEVLVPSLTGIGGFVGGFAGGWGLGSRRKQ